MLPSASIPHFTRIRKLEDERAEKRKWSTEREEDVTEGKKRKEKTGMQSVMYKGLEK